MDELESIDVLQVIGAPALLEQLAEECAELAQAALKLCRRLRNENPTPKTEAECVAALKEESLDVYACLDLLPSYWQVEHSRNNPKMIRWKRRLRELGQ